MAGYVLSRPSALLRLLSANANNNNGAATTLHDRFNVQVNYKNSRQPQSYYIISRDRRDNVVYRYNFSQHIRMFSTWRYRTRFNCFRPVKVLDDVTFWRLWP